VEFTHVNSSVGRDIYFELERNNYQMKRPETVIRLAIIKIKNF